MNTPAMRDRTGRKLEVEPDALTPARINVWADGRLVGTNRSIRVIDRNPAPTTCATPACEGSLAEFTFVAEGLSFCRTCERRDHAAVFAAALEGRPHGAYGQALVENVR